MAFGAIAADPNTSYIVYAFVWRRKVFYIGICQEHSTRHTHRWSFVKNLVRHEQQGTLKPEKRAELERKSNAVVAALVRAGLEAHEPIVLWRGKGQANAKVAEAEHIRQHLADGKNKLANIQGLGSQFELSEVLSYLGVENEANPSL